MDAPRSVSRADDRAWRIFRRFEHRHSAPVGATESYLTAANRALFLQLCIAGRATAVRRGVPERELCFPCRISDLLQMDNSLLGWAFPRGQLSLWLDTNEIIGVTTPIGILMTEILQVREREFNYLLKLISVSADFLCVVLFL